MKDLLTLNYFVQTVLIPFIYGYLVAAIADVILKLPTLGVYWWSFSVIMLIAGLLLQRRIYKELGWRK